MKMLSQHTLGVVSLLKIKSIDVYYGNVQVLWNVSVDVKQDEIITLLGSNGAGKTTTLKTIAGLLRPRVGSIAFKGQDFKNIPAHKRASVGLVLVPEGRHLFANMTVKENLLLGAFYKEALEKKEETLEWVIKLFPRLKERYNQMAGTLSGGEQQMCAIGRALMAKPKMLMLDEPSLGLAPNLVEMVFKTITEVNKQQHVTIFLVEQNAVMALKISSYAYIMENGKIVLAGKAEDLMDSEQVRKAYLGI